MRRAGTRIARHCRQPRNDRNGGGGTWWRELGNVACEAKLKLRTIREQRAGGDGVVRTVARVVSRLWVGPVFDQLIVDRPVKLRLRVFPNGQVVADVDARAWLRRPVERGQIVRLCYAFG